MSGLLLIHAVKQNKLDPAKRLTLLRAALKQIEQAEIAHRKYADECKAENVTPPIIDPQNTVNAKDGQGKTALMYAAEAGWVDGVKELLANKADHTDKDHDLRSVLHYAAKSGNIENFLTLLDLFLSQKSLITSTVESKSIDVDRDKTKADLEKTINMRDKLGVTPLMYAALSLNPTIVATLLEKQANINLHCDGFDYPEGYPTHSNLSALHFAIDSELDPMRSEDKEDIETRRLATVEKLLAANAKVDDYDQIHLSPKQQHPIRKNFIPNRTPLQKAAAACQINVVKCLLLKGANPYKVFNLDLNRLMVFSQQFPLILAISKNSTTDSQKVFQRKTVQEILAKMQSMKNAAYYMEEIALVAFNTAVRKCYPHMIEELINLPMITQLLSNGGANAYLDLNNLRNKENFLFSVVLAQGANENDRTETFKLLMQKGLDLTTRSVYKQLHKSAPPDRVGYTILITAAKYGRTEIVKMLLSDMESKNGNVKKLNINDQDERGATALFCAVEDGHVETVKVLLKANPAPNLALTLNDGTSLFHAAEFSKNPEMMNILFEEASKKKKLPLLLLKNHSGMPTWAQDVQTKLGNFTQDFTRQKSSHELIQSDEKEEKNIFTRLARINLIKNSDNKNSTPIKVMFKLILSCLYNATNNPQQPDHTILKIKYAFLLLEIPNLKEDDANKNIFQEIMNTPLEQLKSVYIDFRASLHDENTNGKLYFPLITFLNAVGNEKFLANPKSPSQSAAQGNGSAPTKDVYPGPTSGSAQTLVGVGTAPTATTSTATATQPQNETAQSATESKHQSAPAPAL